MDVNLVFEGGGALGIYYVGAYKALREYGFSVKRCAGTSAGSIISAVIMAGYNPEEMENIIYETDMNMFNKKTILSKIPLAGKPLSVIFNKGIFNSKIIETWISKLLAMKDISKFKDVMTNGKSNLKVVAADITRSKMLILPDDLDDYDINPGDFSIARSVCMSCAIPYYFTPVKLKKDGKINYIVDGGLLSSFPIWVFDKENSSQMTTLGIKLKDQTSNSARGKHDIISYTKDIINAPINEDDENFIRNNDLMRTIVIDYNGEFIATDFSKVNVHKKDLIQTGYESTIKFLNKINLTSTIY